MLNAGIALPEELLMGIGGISVGSLLIILVIVLLLFGTKKLRNIGGDLGGAIKGFRGAMKDGDKDAEDDTPEAGTAAHLEDKSEDVEAGATTDRKPEQKARDSSSS
ncbi:MAG: twin-arginine translocase TatA/TatE family subunit [Aquisalimonadaceae bacterium]